MFRSVDAAVLRAAVLPAGFVLPPWPDLTGEAAGQVEAWGDWLARVWACEPVAEAIEVASPVLARRVAEACDGRRLEARQMRRMVVSVARYLSRMTSRATPFGLFAGVAPARIGAGLDLRWGSGDRVVARVDAVWLAEMLTRLEQCTELLHRLPVVLNNLAFVRGGRLVVPCQQHADESGRGTPAEVSVRHTRAVETVIRAARSLILVAGLIDTLTKEFPDTAESVIAGLVGELVARRVLIGSLHASMGETDPLGHVLAQLTAAGAEAVPQVASVVRDLREIHGQFARHNRSCSSVERRGIRAAVTEQMAAVSSTVTQPVAVDLRMDCTVVLPESVAREVEAAAAVLARLTPYPSGSPAWRDYHARFLERYGTGALVPVADLVYADTGLGFPAGYRDSLLDLPVRAVTARDERLLALAQTCAIDGGEIVLHEEAVAELAGDGSKAAHPVPHTALCLQVHAETRGVLERGEFELAVVGVSRGAGTTTGRFLHLFDQPDRDRIARAYADLPTVDEGAMVGQVCCPPLYPRAANVARTPAVLPWSIPLAEYHSPGGQVLPLDDLAVGATGERLFLVSLSRRCPVEPAVLTALELRNHTQPIARFLAEIATAHAAACVPFWWGAAGRMPFLPRVRYRRTVLSPARWRLASSDFPDRRASWPEWTDSLRQWRRRFHVPDAVYLGDGDERIRLDLTEVAHRALLRTDLDRAGHSTLCEAPQDAAFGWLGRAHEIVVPLASTSPPTQAHRFHRAGRRRVAGADDGHLPGCSQWLYAKVYGHPDRQDDILTEHLPNLMARWEDPPEWWFLRYHDPQPHLRLRFRLPDPGEFGMVAAKVGAWAADLRRHGIISRLQFDTYYPETGRYGTGPAMAAAESVFAADSAAALAQIAYSVATGGPHPHALAAASLVDMAAGFTGDLPTGTAWLIDTVTTRHPARPPARDVHRAAMLLADPRNDWAAVRALPGGLDIARTWASRRAALAAYRVHLHDSGDQDRVLGSLLHMHHIRAVGLDYDTEAAVLRLARAAALAWTVRTES